MSTNERKWHPEEQAVLKSKLAPNKTPRILCGELVTYYNVGDDSPKMLPDPFTPAAVIQELNKYWMHYGLVGPMDLSANADSKISPLAGERTVAPAPLPQPIPLPQAQVAQPPPPDLVQAASESNWDRVEDDALWEIFVAGQQSGTSLNSRHPSIVFQMTLRADREYWEQNFGFRRVYTRDNVEARLNHLRRDRGD
ncbi:hypothetical protein BDZ45DRAFT_784315 [Acephala macrosclerotiorum]|nr:hypothetical protein BDZ45DRAFT_784315 [Acephala macrosclerotiorum]